MDLDEEGRVGHGRAVEEHLVLHPVGAEPARSQLVEGEQHVDDWWRRSRHPAVGDDVGQRVRTVSEGPADDGAGLARQLPEGRAVRAGELDGKRVQEVADQCLGRRVGADRGDHAERDTLAVARAAQHARQRGQRSREARRAGATAEGIRRERSGLPQEAVLHRR